METDTLDVAGASLNLATIKKYTWREELFLSKIENRETLYDTFKKPVIVEKVIFKKKEYKYNDPDLAKDFKNLKSGRVHIISSAGVKMSISQLIKTTEFGGKSQGKVMFAENRAFDIFKTEFDRLISKSGKGFITLCVYDRLYKVKDLRVTPGTPKSDFHFIDLDGNEVLHISHKAGKRPSDFSQYAGIKDKIEHPEIQDFIKAIHERTGGKLEPRQIFKRKIESFDLKRKAIFGGIDENYSRDNVTMFIQGDIGFVPYMNENEYLIDAPTLRFNNTESLTKSDKIFNYREGYEPWIYCAYRSSSHNKKCTGIENCRFGIYTEYFGKNAEVI